jgi:deoxyribodipyrimidine photo-lyase
MNKRIGIFLFRRDLRLQDNLGLGLLIDKIDILIPIFILDKYQIKKTKRNANYFSNSVVQFMCESLVDLNEELLNNNSRLRLFYGNPKKIVGKLIKWVLTNYKVDSSNIFFGYNCDYSKYSLKRDGEIDKVLLKQKVNLVKSNDDYTLIPSEHLVKSDGNGFKQFGAFYKNAIKHAVSKPIRQNFNNIDLLQKGTKVKSEYDIKNLHKFYKVNDRLAQNGGRINAKSRLKKINNYKDYNEMRDRLDYQTTNLSAYLNFGCLSIREVYHYVKKVLGNNTLILKQLYWRDFYLIALRFLPNGNEFKHMDERYEKIKWKNDYKSWDLLMNSNTGYLIIDAAIQEMKITGFMHNRARMIVGVFWTKYLLINIFHPQYGSQVGYSKHLVDAIGPSQNKMNHQWITEFDFPGKKYAPSDAPIAGRPMDPSNRMIRKWDPECNYIKKWLPHLKDINNKDLFNWNMIVSKKNNNIHPSPIFDHKIKYKEWINACKI